MKRVRHWIESKFDKYGCVKYRPGFQSLLLNQPIIFLICSCIVSSELAPANPPFIIRNENRYFWIFWTLMKGRYRLCIVGRPSSVCLNIEIRIQTKLLIKWIWIFVIPSVCLQRIWLEKGIRFQCAGSRHNVSASIITKIKYEIRDDCFLLPWTRGVIKLSF